jgi:hypothetical protein
MRSQPMTLNHQGPALHPVPVPLDKMADPSQLSPTMFLDCLDDLNLLEGEAIPLHLLQLTFVVRHLLDRIENLERELEQCQTPPPSSS